MRLGNWLGIPPPNGNDDFIKRWGGATPVNNNGDIQTYPEESIPIISKVKEATTKALKIAEETLLTKWPQAANLNEAKHFEMATVTPNKFFNTVQATYIAQGANGPAYADTVRNILLKIGNPSMWWPFMTRATLGMAEFASNALFPENRDLQVQRWYNENWTQYLKTVIDFIPVDPTQAEAYRQLYNNMFVRLFGTGFLNTVSDALQLRYMDKMMPGVLDAADKAQIQTTMNKKNAQTLGIVVGVTIVGGGFLAWLGRKRKSAT